VSPAAADVPLVRIDHHRAHASAAYRLSSFDRATVLVCDHEPPHVTVWSGAGRHLARIDRPWRGPGLTALLAEAAAVVGIDGEGPGQHVEALARLHPDARDARLDRLWRWEGDDLHIEPGWADALRQTPPAGPLDPRDPPGASLAGALQNRIADLVVELLARLRRESEAGDLCLGGSLFYNTHVNSRIRGAGLFTRTFVPANPGNAGLAAGAALEACTAPPRPASPFLGPVFSPEAIKATLDNCKLCYDWTTEQGAIDRAVDALRSGALVGWFEGPMEWGPRALGARSIVANPFAPFVLENLNRFLKQRRPWRGYALSGLEADIARAFDGPADSPFMECDYRPRDAERFRHVLPRPGAAIRVQTVGASAPPRFRALLQAFGAATGDAVLINTSYNGFWEPIVCSPRDAIRVFYGTGLDLLVLDRFVLAK
jgi:carbamoyltransferase